MTEERKAELYAALVKEVQKIIADGIVPTRFDMLKILCDEWGVELNHDALNLIEKLYKAGFVGP